jgi:hypothetical protein
MDPEEFRRFGHQVVDWVADYRARAAQHPVMSRVEPGSVRAQLPASPPQEPESFDAVLDDLDRVVVPGEGTVQLVHRYARDGGGDWAPQKVEVGGSTVTTEVARAAARCMEEAVRGTTLPKAGIATAESELFLHWTWPVPFPPEEERSPRLLYLGVGGGSGSGGSGCDGRGALAQCKNCVNVEGNPRKTLECATVCVGYEKCTEETGPGGVVDTCRLSGNCASGGPFGSVGAVLF